MVDKELEAMFKCNEVLENLDYNSKLRVFKYLLDRYKLVPTMNVLESSENQNIYKEPQLIEEKKINTNPKVIKKKVTKKTNNVTYSLIKDLDLHPESRESLTEFYSKYKTRSNYEKNLVIVYYLERIINLPSIWIDEIYTCYKKIWEKVPSIYQSLIDTNKNKGWINTSDTENLKITTAWENYIEHEIERV